MSHVTAPFTLPSGYIFDANINDDPNKKFKCEVQKGGVVKGQTFLVPLPEDYDGPRINTPAGRWRDGMCDCFTVGFCHPSVWCSWCCDIVALGQLMTRMQLTWLGRPGPLSRIKRTFFIVVMIFTAFVSYLTYFYYLQIKAFQSILRLYELQAAGKINSQNPPTVDVIPMYYVDASYVFVVWFVIALCRTRKAVRERYQIPEKRCWV